MSPAISKTNAARFLDSLGIRYELRDYVVQPEEFSALVVAEKIGLPPEQVFKTLLCSTSEREHVFAVVPGPDELDFKKLARACNTRKTEMASLKEVEPHTGYVRGGVTIFGARKDFAACVDETLELFDVISVSAGTRGVQILLSPADYLKAANGRANGASLADITKDVRA
ncbi:MAG TPA: aminoacyl-tRNA deacylase [Acidobacteriaceae bacterium]|nr:aminoacyl-tRNA deacylase [Acidobacteriaceae bacterium]